MINVQQNTRAKFTLQSIGKLILFAYIVLSFITTSGYLPSSLHSLSLYAMVGVAILCFVGGQKIQLNQILV